MIYIMCVALGMLLVVFLQNALLAISERLNYGKEVFCERRRAGYVVSCRFNGSKKWFFVDELGLINEEYFITKKEAIKACEDAFMKNRPKRTTFPRSKAFEWQAS